MAPESSEADTAAPVVADWIAVDWGTSRLRAWAMDAQGAVLAEAASDDGMGGLRPEAFEPALLALIDPWLSADRMTEVLCCGMVGARQGWREAPYRPVPCTPVAANSAIGAPTTDPRISVRILPGLSQSNPAADVMRGEETQIAGFLAGRPDFDGCLCLPGSHTKWVHISAGEVVSFQTAMTGEIFAALSRHTVLRHNFASDGARSPEADEAAFDEAVAEGMAHPARLAQRMFGLRAGALLNGLSPALAQARMSGFLIGMELSGSRPWWLGQPVALLGSGALSDLYARALGAQGAMVETVEIAEITRAGLAAARQSEPVP